MKKTLAALLAVCLALTPAFAAEKDRWAQLEDSYYQDIAPEEAVDSHDFLQPGDRLDTSRSVVRYSSDFSLTTTSGIEEFLAFLSGGESLYDHMVSDERILVYVENESGENGMAIVDPDKGEIVGYQQGDQGRLMLMDLNDGVKAALAASDLDFAAARCYLLSLGGLSYGILYTDGETELFQSIDSRWDFVSGDTAYTADELAALVEEHTDTLTQFEGVNSDLDPEKANVITGGAPAGTDAPKENADTGR